MILGRILAATNQQLHANRLTGLEPNITTASADAMLADLFRYGVIMAGVLAAVFLTLAGFQYMTTDAVGKKGEAKKKITNIILGLFLALSSVLILRVINPATLTVAFGRFGDGTELGTAKDRSLGMGFLQTSTGQAQQNARPIPGSQQSTTPRPESDLPTGDGQLQPNPLLPPLASDYDGQQYSVGLEGDYLVGPLSEEKATLMLNQAGITVNNPDRTSLKGLQQVTANGIIGIKNDMGIKNMIITGGTESGHNAGTYSHANGYKVDIGKNSNSANWNTIKGYFDQKKGTPLKLGQAFSYETEKYTAKVYYHTGSGEHLDIQFIPK